MRAEAAKRSRLWRRKSIHTRGHRRLLFTEAVFGKVVLVREVALPPLIGRDRVQVFRASCAGTRGERRGFELPPWQVPRRKLFEQV